MFQIQLRKNLAVFIFLLFFFTILFALYINNELDPVNTQIYLNRFSNDYLDMFMVWFTHLGDVWILPILILLYLIRDRAYAVRFLLTGLVISPIVFVLKYIFVAERPIAVFERLGKLKELHWVPNHQVDVLYSFPSGHAAISFAIVAVFAYMNPSSVRKMFWMLFGACLSLSRVYLNEHFLMDILAGAFLGVFFAFLVHVCCEQEEAKLKSQRNRLFIFFARKK